MNAYTTAYIINNFFYAYVLYRMFRIFYADKRTAKSIELTAYSLYAVIISITVFFNTPPLVYLLLSAGSYFFSNFSIYFYLGKTLCLHHVSLYHNDLC